MKKRKIVVIAKASASLISCILPLLSLYLGVVLLCDGAIFNVSFAVTYTIIPLVSIAILILVVFLVKNIFLKAFSIFCTLILFTVSFLFANVFGSFEMITYMQNNDIGEDYSSVCEEFDLMPTLEEVGVYTNLEYYDYFSSIFGIFTCDADTLIVHYDSTEYQKQKNLLDNKYVFQEEEMVVGKHSCTPFATISGYSFRTLDIGKKYGVEIDYPKRMILIATNDKNRTISYTAFYDDDIDYLESLEEFLLNYCGWEHIIR